MQVATDVFFHIVMIIGVKMLGLSSLNDWIGLAYITREKSVVLPED